MSLFRSGNILGTYNHTNDIMKQECPQNVVGASGFIATPVSAGGVMVARTTDLVKAAWRNWKFGDIGGTVIGALIEVSFDIDDGGFVNYTPILSSSVFDFNTGVSTSAGQDYTEGDPHLTLTSPIVGDRVVIGTADQWDPNTETIVPDQDVWYEPQLELEWHGYRWWDSTDVSDTLTAGFAMRFTGTVSPDDGMEWDPDISGLEPTTPTFVSNWLVDLISELASWELATVPLGGSAYDLGTHGTYIADATANFKWGNDPISNPFPLRGYYNVPGAGLPSSDCRITDCEIHFTKLLDPMSPL